MGASNFHIGAGSLSIDGVDIGLTTPEGLIVTAEPTVHLHKSGKHGDSPVKATYLGVNLTLQVTFGETTKENLAKVLAGVKSEDGKIKFGGEAGTEVEGHILVLNPFDGTEPWTFRNAVPTSPIAVAYQVNNERIYQCTFTALIDEAAPADEELAFVS